MAKSQDELASIKTVDLFTHAGIVSAQETLEADFGLWYKKSKTIRLCRVRTGPFGLHGLLEKVVFPILDRMNENELGYAVMRDRILGLCQQLGDWIRRFGQVCKM